MSKHYLLDTNIISYLTDKNSIHREKIKNHLINLKNSDRVSVSIITLYELSYGLYSFQKNDEDINIFKQGINFIKEYLEVLPLGIEEVDIFGKLKTIYKENIGITNSANKKNDLDFLILATSIHHNTILVSNDNIFDTMFSLQPSIQHENWLK